MKEGGRGGGSTATGLLFEKKVSLESRFRELVGYDVKASSDQAGLSVLYEGRQVARMFQKHGFYKFLDEKGVNWRRLISRQILPDDALLVVVRDTLFIIEIKFQQVNGSVDEKLQTCDFKRKQYVKLTRELHLRVEYVYVLNDWYKQPKYKDVLDYVHSMNCHYMFNEIPLKWFGLPVPKAE